MQFSKWVTLGFGALCLVAVAGVLNAQHLYYMAAILLTLPGVSYLLGWYTLRGLEFEREMPVSAWAGDEGDLTHIATNKTRVPRFFLSVHEPLPDWLKPVQEEPTLFNIPAQDSVRVPMRLYYQKRGVYHIPYFDVEALDPLGVFAFKKRVLAEGELVVYPMPQQMRDLSLSGSERYGFQEFVSQALRGSSVDPDGVRAYAPGDPLRHIHWRQTARTGRLSVIEFEETQSISLIVALDLHRGSNVGEGVQTTLEYGVNLAASLIYQAIQQGAGVRLLLADTEGEPGEMSARAAALMLSGRSEQHLHRMLDALARVEDSARQTLSEVLLESGERIAPGTSLLVITSQVDGELPAAVARYTLSGAKVMVAFVDPESFQTERRRRFPNPQPFLSELIAVRAQVYRFGRQEERVLIPEALSDAESRVAQTVG